MDPSIDILLRQTNYSREQAQESLLRNKTVEKSIQEYLGVTKKPEPIVTVNQGIFKSIRQFIDNAS
jgi:hypothetical protein